MRSGVSAQGGMTGTASGEESVGFASEAGDGALSVSKVNALVKDRLQRDAALQNIVVEGEIFNLNYHSSGHIYFSLKDQSSALRCTFFRGANQRYRNVRLQNGMLVKATGGISVYAPRGEYQLNVQRVVPAGEGELRLRIEELKKRLFQEGLFDPARKRPLPYMPFTIGVATAPTGAAVRDIIRTARGRFPELNILLAPCSVQGEGSEASIVAAIEALNHPDLGVDLIIAGRGGGSFEDLLAFNDERVVRAFAASQVPIISAVGHEIDHPLSDLAADAYAATPTGAVEMSVPVREEIDDSLEECVARLKVALRNRHRNETGRLERIFRSRVYERPRSMLEDRAQSADRLERELRGAMRQRLKEAEARMYLFDRLTARYENRLHAFQQRFGRIGERLQNFSPLGTLKRGFALVRNARKDVIRSYGEVQAGETLEVLLGEGRLNVRVESAEARGLEG